MGPVLIYCFIMLCRMKCSADFEIYVEATTLLPQNIKMLATLKDPIGSSTQVSSYRTAQKYRIIGHFFPKYRTKYDKYDKISDKMWEFISRKYPVFQFLGTSINLQKF